MFKTKSLAGILLVMAVLFAQVGTVFAAPATQETTPIVGTIVSIIPETDENDVTTFLVTVEDDMGVTQTVRLSVETALALELVTLDPVTNEPVVDQSKVGQPVEIDPTTVIVDEEGDVHPISALLAAFFFPDDDSMASLIDSYHNGDNEAEQVFGFGVIAQALWMSQGVTEDGNADAELAGLILEAKASGDFSNIILSDGTALTLPDGTVPANWGQFKKAFSDKKNNLGSVVSGQAADDDSALQENGKGNGKEKKNDNGNNGNGRNNNP